MSGSSRSLHISVFTGLRVASVTFTPEYSKNGKNISAKLVCNSFMNIASSANGGEGRNEAVPFTVWGKLAHICAKSFSPGKEWNCLAHLHVYDGRVFMPGVGNQPGTPILGPDGQPLTTKKFSYTVQMLTFGEESNKHIANEIQMQLRPPNWNVAGHPEQAQWKAILQSRQATQFDPNLPQYGYARIIMPQGEGIGAYNPALNTQAVAQPAPAAAPAAPVVAAPVADTTAAVAATFATPVATPAAPVAAPAVQNGFMVKGV